MEAAEVIAAVAELIAEEYPGMRVYIEEIPQQFQRPCFFLHLTEQQRPLMNVRAERRLSLTVKRYPHKTEDAQAMGLAMGEWLHLALGEIVLGGKPRRATAFCCDTGEDGTLVWEAEYREHILTTEKQTKMGSLRHEENVKE